MCINGNYEGCSHTATDICSNYCYVDPKRKEKLPTVPRPGKCPDCIGLRNGAFDQMDPYGYNQEYPAGGIGAWVTPQLGYATPPNQQLSMAQYMTAPHHHILGAEHKTHMGIHPLPAFAQLAQHAPKPANPAEKIAKLQARRMEAQRRQQGSSANQARHIRQRKQAEKNPLQADLDHDVIEQEIRRQEVEITAKRYAERKQQEEIRRQEVIRKLFEASPAMIAEKEEKETRRQEAERHPASQKVFEKFGSAAREREAQLRQAEEDNETKKKELKREERRKKAKGGYTKKSKYILPSP